MSETKSSDERFRELLEKIDPGFRRARLVEQLDGGEGGRALKAMAIAAIHEVQAHTRLLARIEEALAEDESAEAQATLRTIRRQNEINVAQAEHYVAECELVMGQLTELDAAGIAPPSDNGREPSRAERRRASRTKA